MSTERRAGSGRARRLIAGLRISPQDEALLAAVRPFFPEAGSEGELAYRLWRRGLELSVAELVGLGVALPPGTSEELIASLVAQRLLLCVPLLRRAGMLPLLGLAAPPPAEPSTVARTQAAPEADVIDAGAADAVTGLGAAEFL